MTTKLLVTSASSVWERSPRKPQQAADAAAAPGAPAAEAAPAVPAGPRPPWLEPEVIKASVQIGLTEAQQPECRRIVGQYITDRLSMIQQEIRRSPPNLDRVIQGVMAGDNIVWQVDAVEDYATFVEPFYTHARRSGQTLIYFRFARQPRLVPEGAWAAIHRLSPELGFETFTAEIHRVIEHAGRLKDGGFEKLSDREMDVLRLAKREVVLRLELAIKTNSSKTGEQSNKQEVGRNINSIEEQSTNIDIWCFYII